MDSELLSGLKAPKDKHRSTLKFVMIEIILSNTELMNKDGAKNVSKTSCLGK